MKILVTPTSIKPGDPRLKKLEDFADELVFNPLGKPLGEEDLLALLQDCDGYLAGLDQVTEKVIRGCPKLKAISRYGVGYDRVDIAAAKKAGIGVAITPGANSEAVGELSVAMMLALARNIPQLNDSTKNGGWIRVNGTELFGKTLAIIGLGAIGKVVARCAAGFSMKVVAYDPYINEDYCRSHGIEAASLEQAVSQADFISLHLPLTEGTYHMVDEALLSKMKDGTILINCSRGGILDEQAVCKAVESGKLRGVGLDAFEVEPPKDNPLFRYSNVIATPHTGAHTDEAVGNMIAMAVDNLIDMLSGKECRSQV